MTGWAGNTGDIRDKFMKPATFFLNLLLLAFLLPLVSCASNAELEERLERRNTSYQNYQDRRTMRKDARQERTDAWFDRVMH